jgi:hypothetical protein
MRVVIHAGIHRTGTTSLQRCLAQNREALVARGFCYPGTEVHHQSLAWALKRGQAGAADVEALLGEVPEGATAILSGEDFSIHEDLGWLAPVAVRHEVRAVLYLRRQDHWLNSWYNQHVKWPFSAVKSRMDPAAFLATIEDFHWLDFERLTGRWRAALGAGRVAAGVVEKGQVEDVTADFLDRLGIARDGLAFERSRANDSLPAPMLEIARHLDIYELKHGQRAKLLKALRTGLAERAAGAAPTVFTPEERAGVLARFAASNRAVAREFFGREALFLEPPPPPDAPYFRFPDLDRERLMRDWVAPVVHELLKAK